MGGCCHKKNDIHTTTDVDLNIRQQTINENRIPSDHTDRRIPQVYNLPLAHSTILPSRYEPPPPEIYSTISPSRYEPPPPEIYPRRKNALPPIQASVDHGLDGHQSAPSKLKALPPIEGFTQHQPDKHPQPASRKRNNDSPEGIKNHRHNGHSRPPLEQINKRNKKPNTLDTQHIHIKSNNDHPKKRSETINSSTNNQQEDDDNLTPITTSCPCLKCIGKSKPESSKGVWKRAGSNFNIEINKTGYVRCPSNPTIWVHVSKCTFASDNHVNDYYKVDKKGLKKLVLEITSDPSSKSKQWKEELMENVLNYKQGKDDIDNNIMIRIYK